MEFAIPGFIKRYCTPNAILTFKEYLEDYATEETRQDGEQLIADKMAEINNPEIKEELEDKLRRVANGERDLYF